MPRQARNAPGGLIYHVLNLATGKELLFRHENDFAGLIRGLHETLERTPIRVRGYCLMSIRWRLVLWPRAEGQLARFMPRPARPTAECGSARDSDRLEAVRGCR